MKYITNFLKGMAIGIATLIPGVSGGTIAVILNIYDDLIHAISSFSKQWKNNGALLLQIGLGSLLGFLLLSRFFETAMDKYPVLMRLIFTAIIISGLPILFRKTAKHSNLNKKDFLLLLIGFAIVLTLSISQNAKEVLETSKVSQNFLLLFCAGIVIAVALILPGISGSFMLLALGLYEITLNAINEFNVPYLTALGLGILLGTLCTASVIEKLILRYPCKTYMLIIGFIIGSIIPILQAACIDIYYISFIILIIILVSAVWWFRKNSFKTY